MLSAVAEFVSTQPGDSAEFMRKARAVAIGVARNYEPARLYVIRIDNWFGPRWMLFAGKAIGLVGVHKARLHVPPFVPSRVVEQRVFVGPDYEGTVAAAPLHIECPSQQALSRRIEDVDKSAAFLWFSGESEAQRRGSVMVYLPIGIDATEHSQGDLRDCGAFYVGFSQRKGGWEPSMLRGVSRAEMAHIEESGRGLIDNEPRFHQKKPAIPCVCT